MPVSTPGSGTPSNAEAPATAITSGNTTGSTQIAGGPEECAPKSDRHHRDHVVGPEDRMGEAAPEVDGDAFSE